MEASYRAFSGLLASCAAFFAPVAPLVVCMLLFIAVDFLTGIAADRTTTRNEGRAWYFESRKAWRTVVKLALCVTAIVMAWLLACGVELWSFLENAALLSDAPLFRTLQRFVRRRIERETGDDPARK